MIEESKRIVWVDTAKGICILLVVLHHCAQLLHASYPFQRDFMTFRMPLYFILSGLFFKQYGFKVFLIKKTNKLLIPYVFFYLLTGILIPVTVFRLFGYSLAFYDSYGFKAFQSIFSERIICNPSIWFLFCLFEVNLLFYVVFFISKLFEHSTFILGLLSSGIGLFGLFLAYNKIQLPFYFDSCFTVLPFFFFGFYLRNHTTILNSANSKSSIFLSAVFIIVSMVIIHCFNFGRLSVIDNTAGGLKGCAQVYPYGILGTMSVLLLAKMIGKIPVLSYIGRYSIIVLCTHVYIIDIVRHCFSFVEGPGVLLAMVFIMTNLVCLLLIPLFKKYLPCFTAQKDLIKI